MALRSGARQEERSPATERCLPAAFSQALAVVSASTALADPGWLLVQVEGQNYVYGPAYVLHLGRNLTDSDPRHLLQGRGLLVLVLMLICCYVSILFGFSAFLLDFLDTRYKRLLGYKVPPFLHFTTVLSSGAAVALTVYLYLVLRQEVQLKVPKTPPNAVTLGESFYFAICACLASFIATILSIYYPVQRRRGHHPGTPTEDSSPLLQEPETSDSPEEYG